MLMAVGLLFIISFFAAIAYEYFSDAWRMGTLPFRTIVIISGLEMLLPGTIVTGAAAFALHGIKRRSKNG